MPPQSARLEGTKEAGKTRGLYLWGLEAGGGPEGGGWAWVVSDRGALILLLRRLIHFY